VLLGLARLKIAELASKEVANGNELPDSRTFPTDLVAGLPVLAV
jgi:hypothetical protein